MSAFDQLAQGYRIRIQKALASPEFADDERIALAQLLPGFACREIRPFDGGEWSPLVAYRNPEVAFMPRKAHRDAAGWMICSLARSLDWSSIAGQELTVDIVCIGGDATDVTFAKNLAKYTLVEAASMDPTLSNDQRNTAVTSLAKVKTNVMAFIYVNPTIEVEQSETIRYFYEWRKLQEACLSMLQEAKGNAKLLVIDADRCLLLPRGLCDREFMEVGSKAFYNYLQLFAHPDVTLDWDDVHKSYLSAASFPPYRNLGPHNYDEDARVFAAFVLATGLLTEGELEAVLPRGQPPTLENLLKLAKRRVELKPWDFVRQDGLWVSRSQDIWNAAAIERELHGQKIQLQKKDCCIAQAYRAEEEKIMLALAKEGRCRLNGHMIDIIRFGVDEGNALPVAYSDRPSASLGLQLTSYHHARPRSGTTPSLFETPLPLVWES